MMRPSSIPYDNSSDNLTPINVKRADILREVYHLKLVPEPPHPKRVNTVLGNDARAWCAYHRMNGHHIEDYHHLKREIETLIQRGQLLSYVKEREGATGKWSPSKRESDSENTFYQKRK